MVYYYIKQYGNIHFITKFINSLNNKIKLFGYDIDEYFGQNTQIYDFNTAILTKLEKWKFSKMQVFLPTLCVATGIAQAVFNRFIK